MSDKELREKEEYFKEQELLDISDDETNFPDEGFLKAERALADSKAMPPPLVRQRSSFLGPTPKERLAEFETHTAKRRPATRPGGHGLTRSATAPEPEITKSFPVTKPRQRPSSSPDDRPGKKLKKTISMPDIKAHDDVPYYKRMGELPRELKSGKNVKPAENIKLDPEHKQLLRGKIVYFYPNDDISQARRQRIHKVIQLGAAWVTRWRDDITHVMVDDGNHTYSQILHRLNRAGLPVSVLRRYAH